MCVQGSAEGLDFSPRYGFKDIPKIKSAFFLNDQANRNHQDEGRGPEQQHRSIIDYVNFSFKSIVLLIYLKHDQHYNSSSDQEI